MYPKVIIDIEKFRYNTKTITSLALKQNISVMGVSKVFCADRRLVEEMSHSDCSYISDSRIENLRKVKDLDITKVLLRLPMHSEISELIKYADISFNSELSTIKLINEQCKKVNKNHKVVIMIDLGDLREGIMYDDNILGIVKEITNLENITLYGIGVNLTCYGGVIPTSEILQKLVKIRDEIEQSFNIELNLISGGNSSNISLLLNNKIPKGINNLRIGEAICLGRETAYGNKILDMYDDVFMLEAEIIELKEKPTVPIGEIGMNAFGKKPVFDDKGIIKRVIIALGKQDVDYNELIPLDKDIELIGSSSDHIIIDISNSSYNYQVGDILKFKLTYGSLLSLMTSQYVKKDYIND